MYYRFSHGIGKGSECLFKLLLVLSTPVMTHCVNRVVAEYSFSGKKGNVLKGGFKMWPDNRGDYDNL